MPNIHDLRIENIKKMIAYTMLPSILLLQKPIILIGLLFAMCILSSLYMLILRGYRKQSFAWFKAALFQSPFFFKWCALFTVLGLLDVLFRHASWRDFDLTSKGILAYVCWLFFMPKTLCIKTFFQILALTVMCMFMQALYQHHILGIERVYGTSHPIMFGNFAMLLGLICAYAGTYAHTLFYTHASKTLMRLKILFATAAMSGITAAIYSGTRSSWLIFIVYLIWQICSMAVGVKHVMFASSTTKTQKTQKFQKFQKFQKKFKTPKRFKTWMLISLCIVLALGVMALQTMNAANSFNSFNSFNLSNLSNLSNSSSSLMSARLHESLQELTAIRQGDFNSSLGLRLAMWKLSFQTLSTHPWGVGINHFYEAVYVPARVLGELPTLSWQQNLKHPHNDLLWFAVNWGYVGIMYYVILMYAAYNVILGRIKTANKSHLSKQQHALKHLIFAVIWAYVIFGLTQAMFAHHIGALFFMLLLMLLSKLIQISPRSI